MSADELFIKLVERVSNLELDIKDLIERVEDLESENHYLENRVDYLEDDMGEHEH